MHDFLSSVPGAGTASSDPFGEPGNGTHRGEVLLKTRQGRVLPAWIGQSVVGSGTELCTRSVVCDLTPEREWKAALRLARRFQRFFANAPVGVLHHLGNTRPELLGRIIIATAVPEREIRREITEPVFKVHLKPFELPRLLADVQLCAAS